MLKSLRNSFSTNLLKSIGQSKKRGDMQSKIRRFCDIIIALVLMILTAVAVILFGLPLYLETGSVFFRQRRVVFITPSGKHVVKELWKLSSLKKGSGSGRWEDRVVNDWRDPRIGFWGVTVRKTRIDEFPQGYNLLLGDISFVGPRAITVELAERYAMLVPGYSSRWEIKSGITGIAQLFGPECNLEEGPKTQLALDRHYINNRSVLYDLRIIAWTVVYMLTFTLLKPHFPADLCGEHEKQQEELQVAA